jgi:hypothetical protein
MVELVKQLYQTDLVVEEVEQVEQALQDLLLNKVDQEEQVHQI